MNYRDMALYQKFKGFRAYRKWADRDYAAPAPQQVKEAVFRRHSIPNAIWVETGTFKGETTQFLSTMATKVYSIEPAKQLFDAAVKRFEGRDDVRIINGYSEDIFPTLLPDLSGDICFWLDGHYSAGKTAKGGIDTPILQELAAIEAALPQFGKLAVLVDDVRCFDPSLEEYADYPELSALVHWAEKLGLKWQIEHDIFVASTR